MKYVLCCLILVAIGTCSFFFWMTFQITGIMRFPDDSKVVISDHNHNYYSEKTGQLCGTYSSWPEYNSYFGYAFPTQWWNFSMGHFKEFSTEQEIKTYVEKYCPVK